MDIPINSLLCLQGGYGGRLDNEGAKGKVEARSETSEKGKGLMRV